MGAKIASLLSEFDLDILSRSLYVFTARFVRRVHHSRVRHHGRAGHSRPPRRRLYADEMELTHLDISARKQSATVLLVHVRPASIFDMEAQVDKQVAAPAENENAQRAPSETFAQ